MSDNALDHVSGIKVAATRTQSEYALDLETPGKRSHLFITHQSDVDYHQQSLISKPKLGRKSEKNDVH